MKNFFLSIFILLIASSRGFGDERWKEYRCDHFFIYYKEAPEDFVKNVEAEAEQEYQEIAANLGFTRYEGWSWDNRAKIYIYDDQEQYVTERNISWSHGMAQVKEKVIRTFPAAAGFFDSILPHELGHIIFREFVGYKSRIPLWLDEGVAMYQEKAKRWGVNKEVKKAIDAGKFLSVRELTSMTLSEKTDQDTLELFYAESASLIYYMITELGEFRFANLCRELRDGVRFSEAMEKSYGQFNSMDDLNKSWMEYLSP